MRAYIYSDIHVREIYRVNKRFSKKQLYLNYSKLEWLLLKYLEASSSREEKIWLMEYFNSEENKNILNDFITNDLESAIVATLPPGDYTALVHDATHSAGVGLVEVYNLDP